MASVPTVVSLPPTFVTATSAQLNASVNPNGATTLLNWNWGPTVAYGTSTPYPTLISCGSGTTAANFSTTITGLSAGAFYHFRPYAGNSQGTGSGEDGFLAASLMGTNLIAALQPWITPTFEWFLEGVGAILDPVATLVYDQGVDGNPDFIPGYGGLLDPQIADPANLPYLAQFVGVAITPGTDNATAYSLVTQEAGLNRGTIASIVAAVQRNLSGTQAVTIQERTGPDGSLDAYWFVININSAELISLSALETAVNAVKPGGVFYTVTQYSSLAWSSATKEWSQVANTVTWGNLISGQV